MHPSKGGRFHDMKVTLPPTASKDITDNGIFFFKFLLLLICLPFPALALAVVADTAAVAAETALAAAAAAAASMLAPLLILSGPP